MDKKKQTTTAEFSAQYKDPRWQKKRLEILDRDKFTCQKCGDKESTLHVHHCKYEKGHKVWEYGNNELITLCDECHKKVHHDVDTIKWMIGSFVSNFRYEDSPNLDDVHDVLTPLFVGAKSDVFIENILLGAKMFSVNGEEIQEAYADGGKA